MWALREFWTMCRTQLKMVQHSVNNVGDEHALTTLEKWLSPFQKKRTAVIYKLLHSSGERR